MTLRDILTITEDRMNKNEYCTEVIFPYGKSGMIQKVIEIEIKRTFQSIYPNYEIAHPEDNSGLPDIYSYYYEKGIEVKCTKGWPTYKKGIKITDDGDIKWTNGTIQCSDEKLPFLFIKFSIIDNKIQFKMAFFGNISYNDWSIHSNKDMRISIYKVKKLCKRII